MGKEGRPTPLDAATAVAGVVGDIWMTAESVDKVIVCGSVRRHRETVSDVDMLVVSRAATLAEVNPWSERWHCTDKQGWADMHDVRCEFWLCPPESVGPMTLFLTGPASLNVFMRRRAQQWGMRLSQYGLFDSTGERLDPAVFVEEVQGEQALFAMLAMSWIAPEERDEWRSFVH